jgi:hypothetical protein
MSTAFEIRFATSENEWIKAIDRRHDPTVEPIFDLFYGTVEIEVNGESLLGAPYNISVADLACGVAAILKSGFPESATTARFQQGDDALEIDFSVEDGHVLVSSEGRELRVHRHDFVLGASMFVREFTLQACERVPSAVSWKDLNVLAAFVRSGV